MSKIRGNYKRQYRCRPISEDNAINQHVGQPSEALSAYPVSVLLHVIMYCYTGAGSEQL